jgi:hypothetical protein
MEWSMARQHTEPKVAPTDATGGDPTAYVIRGDPLPAIGLALIALAAVLSSLWIGLASGHGTLGVLFLLLAAAATFFLTNALSRAKTPVIVVGPMGIYFARRAGERDASIYQWRDIEAVLLMRIMTGNQSQWRTSKAVGVQLRRPRAPIPVVPTFSPEVLPQGLEERVRRRVELSARQPSRAVGRLSVNRGQLAGAIQRYAPFVPLIDAPMLDFRLTRRAEEAMRRAKNRPQNQVGRTHRTAQAQRQTQR